MTTRAVLRRRMVYETSLLVIGIYAALGPRFHPSIAIVAPLRIDIIALAVFGVVTLLPYRERAGGSASGNEGGVVGARWWAPQILAGALLGAAFVAPWAAVPWLVGPALAMAWAGRGRRLEPGWGRSGVAIALLAAVTSCVVVAAASSRSLRISPEDFAARDFRVNTLLADVPLHDAWAIDLKGHSAPTLEELGEAFQTFSPFQITPAVMGLGVLREVAGFVFGWEDPRWSDVGASFVNRLTKADHQRSTTEPGKTFGSWRVLYACSQEGVAETINGTVHVAVAATLGEGSRGPRLFLSFRVREVNWTTRWYMRLIDPSRRFFVYPFLLRQFAHTWERGDWDSSEEVLTGEEK